MARFDTISLPKTSSVATLILAVVLGMTVLRAPALAQSSHSDKAAPAWPQDIAYPTGDTRDQPLTAAQKQEVRKRSMPPLKAGEFGTDIDNQNNAGTNKPDFDMDDYLYNTDSRSPIEFSIVLPAGSAGRSGTLRMDVYDIDAVDGEVDVVYLNETRIGTLNGKDGQWGVNIFTVGPGILKDGRNTVRVDIDTKNPNSGTWAVEIDWGIIAVSDRSTNVTGISRCWVAPTSVKAGQPVNFFAELAQAVSSVRVKIGGRTVSLSDPDGDKIWSTAWVAPSQLKGKVNDFTVEAISGGKVISTCPTLKVLP